MFEAKNFQIQIYKPDKALTLLLPLPFQPTLHSITKPFAQESHTFQIYHKIVQAKDGRPTSFQDKTDIKGEVDACKSNRL